MKDHRDPDDKVWGMGIRMTDSDASATGKPTPHTPEPWLDKSGVTGQRAAALVWLDGHASFTTIRSESAVLGGNSHQLVAVVPHGEGDAQADARRIVACINACAGMDDPAEEIAQVMENVRLARKQRMRKVITDMAGEARAALSLVERKKVEIINGPSISESEDARRNA